MSLQPMTPFGRVLPGIVGEDIVARDWVTEGVWNTLPAWFCVSCPMSRPYRKDDIDEILHHFVSAHPDQLHEHGLTEQPEPVRVQSSLVDEFGNPLFFERPGGV